MKTKWIKTANQLPELHYIDDLWSMSEGILAYTSKGSVYVAYLRKLCDTLEWIYGEYTHPFTAITHWQPLEAPCLND